MRRVAGSVSGVGSVEHRRQFVAVAAAVLDDRPSRRVCCLEASSAST
jgi:hypothetical protein